MGLQIAFSYKLFVSLNLFPIVCIFFLIHLKTDIFKLIFILKATKSFQVFSLLFFNFFKTIVLLLSNFRLVK